MTRPPLPLNRCTLCLAPPAVLICCIPHPQIRPSPDIQALPLPWPPAVQYKNRHRLAGMAHRGKVASRQ